MCSSASSCLLVFCSFALIRQPCPHLALGPLLDTVDLMAPEVLIRLHPVMHRLQLLSVESIQAALAVLAHRHDPDLAKHTEVLRYRGLRNPEPLDHLPDCVCPPVHEHVDDLAPPRLGNRIEDIRRGRCSWHRLDYIPIWTYMSSRKSTSFRGSNGTFSSPCAVP